MKPFSFLITLTFILLLAGTACTKSDYQRAPVPERKIRFVLYTDQDFSTDNKNIIFTLNIRTHSKTLFDSSLAAMRIKDIPDALHKLVIEKIVPDDDGTDLAVGFRYAIDNVGNSWFIDTCQSGNLLKEVNFSFR